jgi:hypothetical protein
MTLSDFATFSTAISGLAVTASLIYLALQTHQSAKHTKALIQQGRAARILDFSLHMSELEYSEGMSACFAGAPNVNIQDLLRFMWTLRAGLISAEDAFKQHQEGLLDDQAFETAEGVIRAGMHMKGNRLLWGLLRSEYGSEFRHYMDEVVANIHSTDSPNLLMAWNRLAADTASAVPD